jgi:hypothetical protein
VVAVNVSACCHIKASRGTPAEREVWAGSLPGLRVRNSCSVCLSYCHSMAGLGPSSFPGARGPGGSFAWSEGAQRLRFLCLSAVIPGHGPGPQLWSARLEQLRLAKGCAAAAVTEQS